VTNEEQGHTTETPEGTDIPETSAEDQAEKSASPSGPKFTEAPDPLAGIRKGTADVMAKMEGKTVSMKVYVGTIIGLVVLMLLMRCS
jgi:hypothetical protein